MLKIIGEHTHYSREYTWDAGVGIFKCILYKECSDVYELLRGNVDIIIEDRLRFKGFRYRVFHEVEHAVYIEGTYELWL